MIEYIKNEKALIPQIVGVALSVAAAFGLDLTTEQTVALAGAAALVAAIVTRQTVAPVRTAPDHQGLDLAVEDEPGRDRL